MSVSSPTTVPRRAALTSVGAAQVATAGAALFVVLLATLHVLKPELDPSWRFVSEYAIGRHGWLLVAAFLSLAGGYIGVLLSLRPLLQGRSGLVARVALAVSAAGLVIAAGFVTDPITTPADAASVTGSIHNVGGTLGLAVPVATSIVGWKLWRQNRRSNRSGTAVAVVTVAALVAFVASLAIIGALTAQHGGTFGPDVPVGWPNRVEILTSSLWVFVVGLHAGRDRAALQPQASSRPRSGSRS